MSALYIYFPVLIITLLLCYLAGHVLVSIFIDRLKTTSVSFTLLTKLVAGIVSFIFISAVFATSFKTMAIALLPIAFSALLVNKKHPASAVSFKKAIRQVEFKQLLYVLVVAIVSYLLCFFNYVYDASHDTFLINVDYNFYGQVSSFIDKYGVETPRYDFIYPADAGLLPYHYGMVWLNILPAELFNVNHTLTVFLVTIPVMFTLAVYAASELIKTVTGNKILFYAGVVILLFAPFAIIQYPILSNAAYTMRQNLTGVPKILLLVSMYTYALILWFRGAKLSAFISLLIGGVLYFVALPAILVASFVAAVYMLIRKQITMRNVLAIVLPTVASLVYIGVFYLLGASGSESVPANNEASVIDKHLDDHFRKFLSVVVRFSADYFTKIVPFVLLGLLVFRKKIRRYGTDPIIVFAVFLVGASVLLSGFMVYDADSVQLSTRVAAPFCMVLSFAVIFKALSDQRLAIKVIGLALLVLMLIPKINPMFNYWGKDSYADKKVIEGLNFDENPNLKKRIHVATINDSTYYRYIFKENTKVYVPMGYLQLLTDTFICTPIDLTEYDSTKLTDKVVFGMRSYVRYVDEQKTNNDFVSNSRSQVDFIKDFDVQYLVWSEHSVISNELRNMIDSSRMMYSDVQDLNEREYYIAPIGY